MTFCFTVPIPPRPWMRSGHGRWGRYNASSKYQKGLAMGILANMVVLKIKRMKGPVRLVIEFWGCSKRADCDNLLKNFCDAANGVLWDDDSQVVDKRGVKIESDIKRFVVEVEAL